VSLVAAIGVGAGFTLAGSAVRARWTLRLNGSPLLNTAFALEAMLDEVVFIVGPVLVTFLATALHPALGVSVSAVHRSHRCHCPRRPAQQPAADPADIAGRQCRIVSVAMARPASGGHLPLLPSAWCLGAWRSMSSRLRRRLACLGTPV
jgi:hypothetical protein